MLYVRGGVSIKPNSSRVIFPFSVLKKIKRKCS
nr:MAG TPA_asm: hypothetical protein [Caudoviricetes sp.]